MLFLEFCIFQFFLDLITIKARKLKVAELNLILKNNFRCRSLSTSLCCLGFLSCSLLIMFYISLSLSFLNSFVDTAHQLLLYDVMSSSITLITAEF